MCRAALVLVFAAVGTVALGDDSPARLLVVTSRTQPAIEWLVVCKAGTSPAAKEKSVVRSKTFDKAVQLPPGTDPLDVYVRPKDGVAVLVERNLKPVLGTTHTVKLVEKLGVIDVFRRDDSPRVGKIVVTDPFDAGPDEKGHVAVQTAPDFRVEMLVPEGDYAVWVVPENGARAIRVADRVRVLTGRIVRVD